MNTPCPKCGCPNHLILNPSMPTVNECIQCKKMWNPLNCTKNSVAQPKGTKE